MLATSFLFSKHGCQESNARTGVLELDYGRHHCIRLIIVSRQILLSNHKDYTKQQILS